MNYSIDTLPEFEKELKRLSKKYKSMKQDYARLLEELRANPFTGSDLGEGKFKVRMAIASKNRGKSHGASRHKLFGKADDVGIKRWRTPESHDSESFGATDPDCLAG